MKLKEFAHRAFVSVTGSWRRNLILVFRPGYAKRSIAKRKGACRMCGTCCRIVFKCPHLTKDNKCLKHGTGKKPLECENAPVTQRDVDDFNRFMPDGKRCGFTFEPTKE